MSAFITSQSAFPPRKEFLKNQSTTHTFILISFNGSEILRLCNSPKNVVISLKTAFEAQKVYRGFREDEEMGVAEFALADKIFSSKNVKNERLINSIFTVLLSHQFRYVTSISYGRLPQDSRSLVFSKAVPPQLGLASGSRSNSPAVNPSPLPSSAGPSPTDRSEYRSTWALSLTSKSLRVIGTPKGFTPAIFASVRSAWPRGVVWEGRLEDDVYEFQLKGYSLFSNSTFDRDALVHIFGLLRSLDAEGFNLITNVNLTQGLAKSRSKDLWIFDAPADPPSPPQSHHNSSRHSSLLGPKGKEPERVFSVATASTSGVAGVGAGYNAFLAGTEGAIAIQHSRAATSPSPLGRERRDSSSSDDSMPSYGHTRAVTAPGPERKDSLTKHTVLRKLPPNAYQPLVATSSIEKAPRRSSSEKRPVIVVESPASIGSHQAPQPPPLNTGKSYQSAAAETVGTATIGPLSESEYAYGYGAPGYPSGTAQHPPSDYLYQQYVPPSIGNPGAIIYSTVPNPSSPNRQGATSPDVEGLLSADAFRETSYSGTSDASREVPVTWAGSPSDPDSPGGFDSGEPTPQAEVPPGPNGPRTAHAPLPHQPEMVGQLLTGQSSEGRPKSEKAFFGVMPCPPPPSSYPPRPSQEQERPPPSRMESTASTILPPGGFPKTPVGGSSDGLETAGAAVAATSAAAVTIDTTPRKRNGSQATNQTVRTPTKLDRSASSRSNATGSPAGKGWVLVNVEPSRKTSIDNATAAMDAAAAANRARQRGLSAPDSVRTSHTVPNVRANDPTVTAGATATTEPIHESPDESDQEHGVRPPTGVLRKMSLRKKPPTPVVDDPNGTVSKKKLFGIFGRKDKQQKRSASKSSESGMDSPI